jgi:protein-disulfide isomerase
MRRFFQRYRTWITSSSLCIFLNLLCYAQATTAINSQSEEQPLHVKSLAYKPQGPQQLQKAQRKFLQDLKNHPKVVIGQSPIIGSAKLNTVLIEFADFQCPYCAQAETTLKTLLKKYPNLTFVYKNFPLTEIHSHALSAAAAAWAAKQQGKFWQYHDALFANQDKLGDKLYLDIAKQLKLNLTKFKRDYSLSVPAVQKDRQLAEKLGLPGTPFFILKSKNFTGSVELSRVESKL